ncbi:triose-phosphate isomerase [Flavisolibacter nicotianae]|uniref:triose-phosphate isomerase n=1 Tax=Flavisolibacter nicotianae TaxID=2364882 RepID=UPI000EADF60E|nr:triose-phosphate isomerase [Flavisolibacter nicotianae]
MRKQIAAANWKMNLTLEGAQGLLDDILKEAVQPGANQQVIFAVPFPYLMMAKERVTQQGYAVAAQNCSNKKSGAYTGEVSVEMLRSIGIDHCIIGHSERREYYGEIDEILQQKLALCLDHGVTPIFCCGEALDVREKGKQNDFVREQLEKALFEFSGSEMKKIVIAYEPIWAIGTGKTATAEQAQQMHAFIRSVLAEKWGLDVANDVSILYGGSVKGANANELFGSPDVDGGLVGGASLNASEFIQIIKALKH